MGTRRNILVVDDEPLICEMFRTILRMQDYDVECMSNGQQVMQFIKFNHPDMVVLDLYMPWFSGFEVVAAMGQNPDWKKIPIIVVTGRDIDDEAREMIQKGMDTVKFFTKPLEPSKFVKQVKEIFGD